MSVMYYVLASVSNYENNHLEFLPTEKKQTNEILVKQNGRLNC